MFLKGFLEAIGVAVVVGAYLASNAVVVVVGLYYLVTAGHVVTDWSGALTTQHGNVFVMIGVALLIFPELALGLSGSGTGVAVMQHVKGDPDDTEARPVGRIRDTKSCSPRPLVRSGAAAAAAHVGQAIQARRRLGGAGSVRLGGCSVAAIDLLPMCGSPGSGRHGTAGSA